MGLSEIEVLPVVTDEELRFRSLMDARHYRGAAPKIGETIWYAARRGDERAALLSFSAAARARGRARLLAQEPRLGRLPTTRNTRKTTMARRSPENIMKRDLCKTLLPLLLETVTETPVQRGFGPLMQALSEQEFALGGLSGVLALSSKIVQFFRRVVTVPDGKRCSHVSLL